MTGVDAFEFTTDGVLQVRWIRDDGGYHRGLYAPGSDVAGLPDEIKAACEAAWTAELLAGWEASITPTVESKRTVLKSVIISRLIEAEKITEARAALDSDAALYARWWAPDRPAINCDDPDALALLDAIGADPDVIMAP
jgi:hypothetical protein